MKMEPAKREILYYQPQRIPLEGFHKQLGRVFENNWFTNSGPVETELAEAIARLHGVRHCILLANATLALQLTIQALGLKGKVITTPFSFVATTQSLLWQNLEPVFVDIEPDTLTLSPEKTLEALETQSGISGILGVHVFGIPCKVDELDYMAQKFNVSSFYDAAHCFGVRNKGKSIGNFGKAEILSFHATKIFHTFEGGAVLTNDSALAKKIEKMKNFGFGGLDYVDSIGINAKMHEVSAAYGLSFLPHMSKTISRLSEIHKTYRSLLSEIPGISFVDPAESVETNYQYFPIVIDSEKLGLTRDQLWAALWAKKIQTRRYFFPLLSDVHQALTGKSAPQDYPIARSVTNSVLCLPCYVDITEQDQREIVSQIRQLKDNATETLKWFEGFLKETSPEAYLKNVHIAVSRENSAK